MRYLLLMLSIATATLWWRILDRQEYSVRLAAPSGVTVALISGPNGRTLVAGGHDPLAASAWLGGSLPFYVRQLDALVITDFCRLAAGSVPELLSRYTIGHLLIPTTAKRTALSQRIRALAWRSGAQLVSVRTPLEIYDGLHSIQLLPVLEEGRLLVLVNGPSGSMALAHAEDASLALQLYPQRLIYREMPISAPPSATAVLMFPGPVADRPDAVDLSQTSIVLP